MFQIRETFRKPYAQSQPKCSPMVCHNNKKGNIHLNSKKFPENGSLIIG